MKKIVKIKESNYICLQASLVLMNEISKKLDEDNLIPLYLLPGMVLVNNLVNRKPQEIGVLEWNQLKDLCFRLIYFKNNCFNHKTYNAFIRSIDLFLNNMANIEMEDVDEGVK